MRCRSSASADILSERSYAGCKAHSKHNRNYQGALRDGECVLFVIRSHMPSTVEDANRPTRQRSNTTFTPFTWRRGRTDTVVAPPQETSVPLSLDALIEALTPPAVPSIHHARALASVLVSHSPPPRLAILSPVLAGLCSADSPVALQAAGYDILAAYWENSGSAVLTTADRLTCLSLFMDFSIPWSPELWESRFKALVALIHSGTETIGMEQSLLKVLRAWIEGAFIGLTVDGVSAEERGERQRSVDAMLALLVSLVGRPEFVARLAESDTASVLQLFGNMIDWSLSVGWDHASMPNSPFSDVTLVSPTSTTRIPLKHHHRHHSSVSIAQVGQSPSATDLAVESYLGYLSVRLKAIAPMHLKTILPHLFRSFAYYASPLPRLSLTSSSEHQNDIEKRIMELLDSLVTGPYSASVTVILKYHLYPNDDDVATSARTSLGALRTLRTSIRRVLMARLARAYISRTSSVSYTPSGAPGALEIDRELLDRAWAKDDITNWDLNRFRSVLCVAIREWLTVVQTVEDSLRHPCEQILSEVAGILKDITQAFDEIGDELDYEEVEAVGDVLHALTSYVKTQRHVDGAPIRVALTQTDVTTGFLSLLSTLLAQDLMVSPLHTVLPSVILSIVEHIPDADTAHLVATMSERQAFSPTTPSWLDNWRLVLSIGDLYTNHRSATRHVITEVLRSVWSFVKDISVYRRPLAALVFEKWKEQYTDFKDDTSAIIIWRVLGDEVVLRNLENAEKVNGFASPTFGAEHSEDPSFPQEKDTVAEDILTFLSEVALESYEEDVWDFHQQSSLAPSPPSTLASSHVSTSPILSRVHSDYPVASTSKESGIPSVMSLLSSFTSGHSSRSQSQPPHAVDPMPSSESLIVTAEHSTIPRAVGAVVALVSAFSQLAFASFAAFDGHLDLAERLYKTLVSLLEAPVCSRVKIVVLQFCMRLRADRDHRLYYAAQDFDQDGLVAALASLIGRGDKQKAESAVDDRPLDEMELRKARARLPQQERMGRRLSRGRGGQPSASGSSRSRSRVASRMVPVPATVLRLKPREQLWSFPETITFSVPAEADTPSSRFASYDPDHPLERRVLPLSHFLSQIVTLIKTTRDWDILSYILCHLPSQLANKHLFCGPRSAVVLNDLLQTICSGILDGRFAGSIERWPDGVIARDAQGLAYHTLTVLISYKRCFKEIQLRHMLIEAFLAGLNGSPSTIKCCLNALSLSAFELQPSMTKYLPRILEKLSQIMSNPTMAVHIIDFLAIVGSLPTLYSNFTEGDYKMVFGVALQYLQQHNRPESHQAISWALAQHVCIMSYYIVYLWFLAVKLPDRPRHIRYITRQLLLANEGRDELDEPTEVCFDWLARYTYASADPRPAQSMLDDIIMHPTAAATIPEPALAEKTWILGNSVVTIRALAKRGWVEVVSRRASGMSKFLCRAENVPMITPGDVDPDLLSVCASLTMDRPVDGEPEDEEVLEEIRHIADEKMNIPRPDPITGYVWSRSAPSQRRKEVAIDPSFFALQLSSYPDNKPSTLGRLVSDSSRLPAFFRSIDRMPVIDTHKVGIMYVAPGQSNEKEILENTHGSPAYTRFLEGLGRLIHLRGQVDVYAGGLDPDEDGEYAYAWWDDIGQVLYHTATLMPNSEEGYTNKKRHIGNDYVRIVWNDSGFPYKFDTLSTQFQFVNIVIEPHSRGAIAAFSDNLHENEYFKVVLQRAPGMPEFTPLGEFKLISAEKLPLLVRQLSLLTDWFVTVYQHTQNDTAQVEMVTNWRSRLQAIKRFRGQVAVPTVAERVEGIMGQEAFRDFTASF